MDSDVMPLLFAALGFPSSRTQNRNLRFLVSRPRSGPSSRLTTDQHFVVSAPSKLNNVILSKPPAFILVVMLRLFATLGFASSRTQTRILRFLGFPPRYAPTSLLTTAPHFFVGQALG